MLEETEMNTHDDPEESYRFQEMVAVFRLTLILLTAGAVAFGLMALVVWSAVHVFAAG